MAQSEHLKDFKAVWGDSCQSMWAELLSLTMAESYVVRNYAAIPADRLLTDMFHVPKLRGRLKDLRRDTYLARATLYRQSVITNRLVILSASFETYLSSFLDAFIRANPRLWDKAAAARTPDGDKFFAEIAQVRGVAQKIIKFGELAPSKIKSIEVRLSYLDDVYLLRHVLAYREGRIDANTTVVFKHVKIAAGTCVVINTDQLLELAAQVTKIAELLDRRL